MTLIGIDLGIKKLAVAVFTDADHGENLVEVIAHESRCPTRDEELAEIAAVAHNIALLYNADWCFIEEPIVGNNTKYSLKLSQTAGAVMAGLSHLRSHQGLDIRMVGNKTWKKEVIGNGNSSKDVIRSWVIEYHPAYAALCGDDQDEYDACCIGLYGLGLLDRARQLTL
jgi:Holliday junction resolvasome RuvABC endonuclease subunit